jgi:hypothetical protein
MKSPRSKIKDENGVVVVQRQFIIFEIIKVLSPDVFILNSGKLGVK